ncbi:unnamed protein product [Symbiodinium natans]|uniref:Uncharacterized protein n=1 Tax=Symbiodinium natans TaxID=878477 RepID=A0A812PPZ2_9DINO|nr:unnamed protein product [Symbiodinium natans]
MSSVTVHVALLSGEQTTIVLPWLATIEELRQMAQEEVSKSLGKLVSSSGAVLLPSDTLQQAGVQAYDVITAVVRDVVIAATKHAFAAILSSGTVVAWGARHAGGDCSAVQHQLQNVQQIQSSAFAFAVYDAGWGFAAIKAGGRVVFWGLTGDGEQSTGLDIIDFFQAGGNYWAAATKDGHLALSFESVSGHGCMLVPDGAGAAGMMRLDTAIAVVQPDGTVRLWGDSRACEWGRPKKPSKQIPRVKPLAKTARANAKSVVKRQKVSPRHSLVFRTHLHVLWHLGKTGLPEEEAAVAAAHAEAACHFALSAVGDHADRHELDCEEESWMGFCKAHYVIRFSSEPCAVPAGGAPPRAALRVAAFGSASESLQDRVHGCPLQTGGRLWVSELLLARELLARPLAGQVVLELGCGVGVAGIAAASRAAGCILTDVEPGVLEAAALNLRYTGGPACAGKVELLDLRNLEAVSCLALACRATVVIAADLIYGAVSQEEVARAVRAALPHGGSALLLMPQHYRPGMEKDGFGQALVSAGMETVSALRLQGRGFWV